MTVTFRHASGTPVYEVPGYFAADGNASETSADAGTKWRAHLSPDKTGKWTWRISFATGKGAALDMNAAAKPIAGFHGKSGGFSIAATDKSGRDFRGRGRLQYVGKHYLQFAGSKEYFLKAGPMQGFRRHAHEKNRPEDVEASRAGFPKGRSDLERR
jgi:hypothetical protein